MRKRNEKTVPASAVNELMDLCCAWLGILLRRLGTGELRVNQREVKEGLEAPLCEVCREGETYVIRLKESVAKAPAVQDGEEAVHGGEEA